MFENDTASHGLITAGELRKRLKGVPSEAVVCACVDGFSYAPITDAKFDGPTPQGKAEGEIGVFLVMPDPSSELIRSLPSDPVPLPNMPGPHDTIAVKVLYSGVVEVQVPHTVPVGRRRPLAEKLALARIVATTDNPDAPEDRACEDYEEEHELSEEQAEAEWDSCRVDGCGGGWSIRQGKQQGG